MGLKAFIWLFITDIVSRQVFKQAKRALTSIKSRERVPIQTKTLMLINDGEKKSQMYPNLFQETQMKRKKIGTSIKKFRFFLKTFLNGSDLWYEHYFTPFKKFLSYTHFLSLKNFFLIAMKLSSSGSTICLLMNIRQYIPLEATS